MLGFAIFDRQRSASAAAVWLTTHIGGTTVQHTNAVVLTDDDPDYARKVYALTGDRIVVLTDGSAGDGLVERPHGIGVFELLIAETQTRRQRIVDAVTAYMARTKNKNLVIPDFPARPSPPAADQPVPQLRALAAANYVAAVWSGWLVTEEQRLRRTTDPRTGTSPWIMPEELADSEMVYLPREFAASVRSEPLRAC